MVHTHHAKEEMKDVVQNSFSQEKTKGTRLCANVVKPKNIDCKLESIG